MKGKTLSYVSCVVTASNNTSSLHSTTILIHTLSLFAYVLLRNKNCYFRNDKKVTCPMLRYSSVVSMDNLTNLENSYKINDNSTTIMSAKSFSETCRACFIYQELATFSHFLTIRLCLVCLVCLVAFQW